MTHFPKRRRWPMHWLPDRCSCGMPRYDRCGDAVADAISGAGAPRGGQTAAASAAISTMDNRARHEGDDPQSRVGRW